MVWGMSLPSSFGDFWPSGKFEGEGVVPGADGWNDRLKQYFLAQTAECQRELSPYRADQGLANHAHGYPYFVSLKFISKLGICVEAGTLRITEIKPHEPPIFYQTDKNQKGLGSLIELSSRMIAVDEALKSIIERMEPGVHQFFPLEIRMRRFQVYPSKYYILVVGKYLDSFLPERSIDSSYRADGPNFYFHEETKKAMSGLAFSQALFGNAHLWRERSLSREWLTCFSDDLIAEIAEAGLRLPKHYQMKEV